MRTRVLKQVTVRGGHPLADTVVDARFTDAGVDLVDGDGRVTSVELAGPPISVRWGYVLTPVDGDQNIQLVQCAECAERKENPGG